MNDDGFNSKLSVVTSEKDSGVWITSKPDFSLQCDKASVKATYAIPRANKKNFYQLDKRIISNDLHSLYCRRQRGDLIEVHKLVNHLIQVSPDPFFKFVNSQGTRLSNLQVTL